SFASGIGNELTETKNILKGYFIVVVKPNVSVSTVQAYAGVEPRQPKINLLELYHSISLEDWKNHLFNDFEESVFKLFPQINDCKQQLYLNGAVYASMSGSGSAVYGIFRHEVDLKKYFNPKYFIWQGFLE
ncbi:MAG: 4-(cytidine 5'-diphospho)-2-C-methyl-D-erythritol kinase, partial [Bacteroidia bacterium]|nr:4-(cytidine 5'-diphospho)-2-C-methyl-D-erythritol kinase [Bacteroidia bacterium]